MNKSKIIVVYSREFNSSVEDSNKELQVYIRRGRHVKISSVESYTETQQVVYRAKCVPWLTGPTKDVYYTKTSLTYVSK